jgi:hypothetical protein
MDTKTQRIRALNDQLRQNFGCGIAVMTPGIAACVSAETVTQRNTGIMGMLDWCLARNFC